MERGIIETIATKDDVAKMRDDIKEEFAGLRQDMRNWSRDIIRRMFILSVAQVVAILTIVSLLR